MANETTTAPGARGKLSGMMILPYGKLPVRWVPWAASPRGGAGRVRRVVPLAG